MRENMLVAAELMGSRSPDPLELERRWVARSPKLTHQDEKLMLLIGPPRNMPGNGNSFCGLVSA